jgi:von Willebrand factor type A domain
MTTPKYLTEAQRVHAIQEPESVCIVLDTSPSMEWTDLEPSRLHAACEAVHSLVEKKLDMFPFDRVAIVTFNSKASRIQELAAVGECYPAILSAISSLETDSWTNIGAGLQEAGRILDVEVRRSLPRFFEWLRVSPKEENVFPQSSLRITLLSDGEHNTGGCPKAVANELKARGVVIDTIGIGSSPEAKGFDEKTLKAIASLNADGTPRYSFIKDTENLIRAFEEMAHHIRPV